MASKSPTALARKVVAAVKRVNAGTLRQNDKGPVKLLLLGALSEHMPGRTALIALNRIERNFVDWNEVRVSSLHEIAEAMQDHSDGLAHAKHVRRILKRVFDLTNDMSMAELAEMSPRESARLIGKCLAPPPPPKRRPRVTADSGAAARRSAGHAPAETARAAKTGKAGAADAKPKKSAAKAKRKAAIKKADTRRKAARKSARGGTKAAGGKKKAKKAKAAARTARKTARKTATKSAAKKKSASKKPARRKAASRKKSASSGRKSARGKAADKRRRKTR